MIRGTKARTQIIWRRCWPEEDDSRDQSPQLEYYRGIKKPRVNDSRDRNPLSNNMKALLGQKNQFEEQESPHSNIVEVSKNPKRAIRGTETHTREI
jgi:hypothetical protein